MTVDSMVPSPPCGTRRSPGMSVSTSNAASHRPATAGDAPDVAASTASSSGAPHDSAGGGLNGTGAASGRSGAPVSRSGARLPDDVAREIAVEQAHVDRVHAELEKAGLRADSVQAEGLARSQFGRLVEVGDAEGAALFERDALMFHAAKRRTALDTQYEGLVFGRLDLDHRLLRDAGEPDGREASGQTARKTARRPVHRPATAGRRLVRTTERPATSAASACATTTTSRSSSTGARRPPRRSTAPHRPSRWACCAAASCAAGGATVIGVEDDLMVPAAPDDLVVVGDGALMAALTRSRVRGCATSSRRSRRTRTRRSGASARGVTEITGGPGTGKTVVALHRAAYLLYSDRRRFESGGILVVGPSGAYTAYIERVLPSLGEDSVTLRAIGDVIDAVNAERLDSPAVARLKGSTRIRGLLSAASRGRVPDAPDGVPRHGRGTCRAPRGSGARPRPRARAAPAPAQRRHLGSAGRRSARPRGRRSA